MKLFIEYCCLQISPVFRGVASFSRELNADTIYNAINHHPVSSLDKCWSAEQEAAGSNPARTNTQVL